MELSISYRFHTQIPKKVVYGKVKEDLREILRTLCQYKKVEIVEGAVCSDHVHLCVSIPPKNMCFRICWIFEGKISTNDT